MFIKCPQCGSIKIRQMTHFVTADLCNRCADCGLWFDLDEIQLKVHNYGFKE